MNRTKHVTSNLLTVLALCVISLGFASFLLYKSGVLPSMSHEYRVRAVVPSAVSLTPGASVKIAGLDAGRVKKIELRGAATVVEFTLDKAVSPIPSDSHVAIRLRSLIGENYLEVIPGRSRSDLADNGTVPEDRTSQYVDVEQIIDQFKGKTRDRARQLIQGVGFGLRGRGQALNATLGSAADLVQNSAPVTEVLGKDRVQAATLVRQFGDLSSTIGARGAQIKDLAVQARTTAQAVADRDQAVGATLVALPPTLRQLRKTSGALQRISHDATPVLNGLATTVSQLDPAITDLRPAAQQGREAVRELGLAAPRLQRTLGKVTKLAGPLSKTTPQVKALMCQLNPTVKWLAPYSSDLGHLIANLASVTNFYDATGHAGRLQAMVGDSSYGGTGQLTSKALQTLLNTGLVSRVKQGGFYPNPPPGGGGNTTLGKGGVGPSDVKVAFPHVEAEC